MPGTPNARNLPDVITTDHVVDDSINRSIMTRHGFGLWRTLGVDQVATQIGAGGMGEV